MSFLTKRGGVWWFQRRIPAEFADIDSRLVVKQSTRVKVRDDRAGIRASVVVDKLNSDLEAYWTGLKTGGGAEAKARYETARKHARTLGFVYAPVHDVAKLSIEEIHRRAQTFDAVKGASRQQAGVALLGGVSRPKILLSKLFDEFQDIVRADIRDLSKDQLRLWTNPKKRAVANLISVIGDPAIDEITRPEAIEFRSWWQDRVIKENLNPATANKDIGNLQSMLRTVDKHHRLELDAVFAELRLATGEDAEPEPFPTDFVRQKLLAPGALASLNEEARDVIFVMTETGMRPSEIVNLTFETIALKAPVPHVMVRPDGRRMKTDQSRRDIPLVGVALAAAKRRPDGFPRYRDKANSLSATVNKFLDEHGLRPTDRHTLYSLRHSFEDRLTSVEAPEKLMAALMGHKYDRPRYGKGPSLEQKRSWLLKIAFPVPKALA